MNRAPSAQHVSPSRRSWSTGVCVTILLLIGMTAEAQLRDSLTASEGAPSAPPLVLETLDGSVYDLQSKLGTVVVVNFWATWCPPCIEEMPALTRLWEQLAPCGLEVIAVNAGEYEQTIEQFREKFSTELPFPIAIDKTSDVFRAWNVRGLPMTFVIDKQGRIVYTAEGAHAMDSEPIMSALRQLIEE